MKLADAKRMVKVGTTLRIVNHKRPQASRIATVLRAQTKAFATSQFNDDRPSWTTWPKATDFRGEPLPLTFSFLAADGEPWITYTVLEVTA